MQARRAAMIGTEVMLQTIGQYIGAKVVTAVLVVSGGCTVIYFYKNPDDLATIWVTLKYAVAWLAFAAVLPWAMFLVTRWVVSKDSNTAAALMLAGYALADAVVAFWLLGGVRGHAALTWVVVLLGFLSAAVYNFKVCEFQAEHFEECY
jgi:hypothetical protein